MPNWKNCYCGNRYDDGWEQCEEDQRAECDAYFSNDDNFKEVGDAEAEPEQEDISSGQDQTRP